MKKLILTGLLLTLSALAFAQKPNWQHLELQKDSVFGMSTKRAYNELLRGKKSKTVIVAVVDCGVDTTHEDLKDIIWSDPKTGHHGWNYIGPETGQEDITRLVGYNKEFYDSLAYAGVPEKYRGGYQNYQKLVPALNDKRKAMEMLEQELKAIGQIADQILAKMDKTDPTIDDFRNYKPATETADDKFQYKVGGKPNECELVQSIIKRLKLYPNWQAYRYNEIDHIGELVKYHLSHGLSLDNNEADTAKGNFDVSPDKLGPVSDPNWVAYHGTHVAGIIGAVRNNGIGMDGVADNVKIMMLKDNGTLREMRDKCVADAIHFAVDHGAKVINLSFGKPYTWDKKDVDEAVRYAMKHDVLIVHAAGNSHENLDNEEHYPNPVFLDKTKANNWLEVGASGPKNDNTLSTDFSNYGKRDVDVFAPGVAIYSTFPYNQYHSWDGTSMAAPSVSGLAALIREYYPKLTAIQVRDIIFKSVVKSDYLKDKCASGGVVNTYNAIKLAETYK